MQRNLIGKHTRETEQQHDDSTLLGQPVFYTNPSNMD